MLEQRLYASAQEGALVVTTISDTFLLSGPQLRTSHFRRAASSAVPVGLQLICRAFGRHNFLGILWRQPSGNTSEIRRVRRALPHDGQIRVDSAGVVPPVPVAFCVDRVSHESLRARACSKRACSRQQRLPSTTSVQAKAVWGRLRPLGICVTTPVISPRTRRASRPSPRIQRR